MPDRNEAATGGGQERAPAVEFIHTTGFPDFLRRLGISLAVTAYQAQRLMTIAAQGGRLSLMMRVFERPTGLAVEGKKLALVTRRQVWLFESSQVRGTDGTPYPYDACFVPRMSYVTGDIAGHEAGWVKDTLVAVNSRFSCLCTVTPRASFLPLWKPPFISDYAPQDRCHLNGMAIGEGGVRFVTALGDTDTEEGWRQNKVSGGVVVDV